MPVLLPKRTLLFLGGKTRATTASARSDGDSLLLLLLSMLLPLPFSSPMRWLRAGRRAVPGGHSVALERGVARVLGVGVYGRVLRGSGN